MPHPICVICAAEMAAIFRILMAFGALLLNVNGGISAATFTKSDCLPALMSLEVSVVKNIDVFLNGGAVTVHYSPFRKDKRHDKILLEEDEDDSDNEKQHNALVAVKKGVASAHYFSSFYAPVAAEDGRTLGVRGCFYEHLPFFSSNKYITFRVIRV